MSMSYWTDLYNRFLINNSDETAIPKPIEAELELFEHETGIKLPHSYRDFIQVFGPGEFGGTLSISSPVCRNYKQMHMDLSVLNTQHNFSEQFLHLWNDRERQIIEELFFLGLQMKRIRSDGIYQISPITMNIQYIKSAYLLT